MQAPVSTKVALLQALRDGPGYGQDLIRRVRLMTTGRLSLSPGRVYPALRALATKGLTTGQHVSPKGARGARSRTYYALTPRGLSASSEQRGLLTALVRRSALPMPDAAERTRMAERLLAVDELAELGTGLERAMRRTR